MLQYRVNKCVFNSLRKLSLLTLGSHKLSGSEFQADGPAAKKAPSAGVAEEPVVVDWWTWDSAEKRRRRLEGRGRPSTAAPDRVGNCAPWQSLYVTRSGTLSQCSVCSIRDTASVELVCAGNHTSHCSIHYSLKLVSRRFWRTCQNSVTVVDVWRHKGMHVEWTECCSCRSQ